MIHSQVARVPPIFSNVDAILKANEEHDLSDQDDLVLKEVSVDATFLGKNKDDISFMAAVDLPNSNKNTNNTKKSDILKQKKAKKTTEAALHNRGQTGSFSQMPKNRAANLLMRMWVTLFLDKIKK